MQCSSMYLKSERNLIHHSAAFASNGDHAKFTNGEWDCS